MVFYRLDSAIERGTKPDAWGWKPCHWTSRLRLLLDSRVVDVPRSSHLLVVTLSSSKPFFVNGLKKAVPFSGDVGAEDPGIQ